jgi:serine/threonine protein kinase
MTTTTEHTGTERYLAPELVMADDGGRPTIASDVYALGCIGLEVRRLLAYSSSTNFPYSSSSFKHHIIVGRIIGLALYLRISETVLLQPIVLPIYHTMSNSSGLSWKAVGIGVPINEYKPGRFWICSNLTMRALKAHYNPQFQPFLHFLRPCWSQISI